MRERTEAAKAANEQSESPAAATARRSSGSYTSAIHAAVPATASNAASAYATREGSFPVDATTSAPATSTTATANTIDTTVATTAAIVGTSILGAVELAQELERIAGLAAVHAAGGERLAGILATEPDPGKRTYLCAFEGDGARTWLALDADGTPIENRARVREAVSIAALCELADETAGGGDLSELRSQLVALRLTENPPGIDEAEEAALALEGVVGTPPRLATPEYLDAVGAATIRLERALGDSSSSPFAQAMRQGVDTVDELTREVEAGYKGPLDG